MGSSGELENGVGHHLRLLLRGCIHLGYSVGRRVSLLCWCNLAVCRGTAVAMHGSTVEERTIRNLFHSLTSVLREQD